MIVKSREVLAARSTGMAEGGIGIGILGRATRSLQTSERRLPERAALRGLDPASVGVGVLHSRGVRVSHRNGMGG